MAEQPSETPVLDLLAGMTADSIEASDLDPQTLMLVRIAALVAVDAPPASYLMNLGAAAELGIGEEQVRGVLAAVAPIVGTRREWLRQPETSSRRWGCHSKSPNLRRKLATRRSNRRHRPTAGRQAFPGRGRNPARLSPCRYL